MALCFSNCCGTAASKVQKLCAQVAAIPWAQSSLHGNGTIDKREISRGKQYRVQCIRTVLSALDSHCALCVGQKTRKLPRSVHISHTLECVATKFCFAVALHAVERNCETQQNVPSGKRKTNFLTGACRGNRRPPPDTPPKKSR